MTDAIILHAPLYPLRAQAAWEVRLLQALPYARRLELERREAAACRASLAGLGLVMLAASRIGDRRTPAVSAFRFPAGHKPLLQGGPSFSVAHTDACVVCIVAQGSDCGIDIEDLPVAMDSATERKLARWTATEAVLKAAGLGLRRVTDVVLADSLERASVGDELFTLQPLCGVPGCVGHVSSRSQLEFVTAAVEIDGPAFSAALERSLGLAAERE